MLHIVLVTWPLFLVLLAVDLDEGGTSSVSSKDLTEARVAAFLRCFWAEKIEEKIIIRSI